MPPASLKFESIVLLKGVFFLKKCLNFPNLDQFQSETKVQTRQLLQLYPQDFDAVVMPLLLKSRCQRFWEDTEGRDVRNGVRCDNLVDYTYTPEN